ncbi:trypsin-like serine protease [Gonapodya prolifera JEL478]|uniref:Trypsin-like serine protease n=1 Tax=Gonapodya prolifera (strain JEL478) TaxID=1344416 RepID=A0A139AH45_GONPJ|nr:trypsin-like serine protease [Gonapodya prolifera JEL478]|eukprot:KXS16019.1 trypsin-like serine protease [Gonapodya prolifera JEL478]
MGRTRNTGALSKGTIVGLLYIICMGCISGSLAAGEEGVTAGSLSRRIPTTSNGIKGTNFIIGGSAINPADYPYTCLLDVQPNYSIPNTINYAETCSGVLIQATPVPVMLTTAHCGSGGIEPFATVYAGKGNKQAPCSSEPSCTQFNVLQITINPQYAPYHGVDKYGNDLAVWALKQSAPSSAPLITATLNSDPNFPPIGVSSMALGWGYTNVHGDQGVNPTLATTLQGVPLQVADNTVCENAYFINPSARDGLSCLLGSNSTGIQTSTCLGDSGGPHVYNGIVYGITNFGPLVCDSGEPLVAAKTAHSKAWLDQVLGSINAKYGGSPAPTSAPVSTTTTSSSPAAFGLSLTGGDAFSLATVSPTTKPDATTSTQATSSSAPGGATFGLSGTDVPGILGGGAQPTSPPTIVQPEGNSTGSKTAISAPSTGTKRSWPRHSWTVGLISLFLLALL